MVREVNPNIEAMYVDTGLEYPEIKQFVKTYENVTIIRPKIMFDKVIEKYGFPIISKEVSECIFGARRCIETNGAKYQYRLDRLNNCHLDKNGDLSPYNMPKWKFLLDAPFKISNQCCNVMKKGPAHKFYKDTGKTPIIATMAEESRLRTQQYIKQGCTIFTATE